MGKGPQGIVITVDGATAFVTNKYSNNLSVINLAQDQARVINEKFTLPSTTIPYGIAVAPNRLKAYITNNGSNNVGVIDVSKEEIVATITVGLLPRDIAITPNGAKGHRCQ